MKLFDLSLKLNGFPIKKARAELELINERKSDGFEDFIHRKKSSIVDYHLEHNPFYKSLIQNSNVSEWDELPVMTKSDLQIPLEKRLSKNFKPKDIYINKTSGSSGDPFTFAKDRYCHAMTWALITDRFGWYGLDFNSSKQARFYGIPLEKSGYYKERIKDYFSSRYRFSVFDLSDSALRICLDKFKITAFDYINGYTSSIVQFAKYLNRKGVVLKSVCPSLKVCIVTSEMLFDEDKLLLERQFGVPIVNEYGASELDLIAFQNRDEQWQVNCETLFVEILDDDNKVLPLGNEGRIVITSLFNKAHPFIRYDIGDIGRLSEDSSTSKPILSELTGRTNDMIILPSGKKAAGLTFYYITKSIIEKDGKVKEFIIEQETRDTFKIQYVSKIKLSKDNINKIRAAISRYLETDLIVNFEKTSKLIRSKSGKLKQFSSLIQHQD